MPRDISWLSPKRRRTTTAVPTVKNGHSVTGEDEEPLSPTPRFVSPKPVLPSPSLGQRRSRTFSSASSTTAVTSHEADGNLFYAYARQADDLHSRYLLTFASASVANEWWSLIQTHFPDTTRPGPQLFSFQVDDFLGKAWKHAAFAQLKPKWMYIQFEGSTGGAAQGIIPVQDARGNMLGGASSNLEQQYRREARKEARNEVNILEERFEKMTEAVERNTEQISALTTAKTNEANAVENKKDKVNGETNQHGTPGLSAHLDRISQLLEQNSAHVAKLTERQMENEERMRVILENQSQESSKSTDMSQLTSHLDRIQRLMERNTHERKDSARDIRTSPPRIDLTPLTFWLEKVLGAVEQNSELVKELLQDNEGSKRSLHAQQVELDLSPLSQRLDDLLDAQEAKSTRDQEASVQLIHRLDKVVEAQHKAVERGPFDVSLLSQRLDEILSVHRNAATVPILDKMDQLVEAQKTMDFSHILQQLEDLVAETATLRDAMDYAPLTEPLEAIRTATEQNNEHLMTLVEAHQSSEREEHYAHDLETQTEHLEALRATTEQNSATMAELLESLASNRQELTETSMSALTPFDDHVSTNAERQSEGYGLGDTKFLISALAGHLSKIQAVTESNANAVRSTRESSHALQKNMTSAVSETSGHIRALSSKHKEFAAQTAVREGHVREVMRSQAEMVECVRELAKTIKTQSKDTCNHVVIPPPRKTNRKVVGFVYDAKDAKS
ncbi:hypothetical protein Q7P37_004193 [Cladosporium fusiforme]